MDWLIAFSRDYANAVMAFAACGALILAAITHWYLKREYSSKYRPYVFQLFMWNRSLKNSDVL